MKEQSFDIVVVGAGTAGAAAARAFAQRGRAVALVDARRLDQAGARWVNGVPPWMFDVAGVPRPEPPERRADSGAFGLHGVSGRRYLTVDPSPVWGVDMRMLVARLQRDAADAGATLLGETRIDAVELTGRRPTALLVRRGDQRIRLRAALFVDASGMNGVVRRRVPTLAADCPRVPRVHVCSAAQAVFTVRDVDGARGFLARHGARPGDVVCRAGVSGGYSIDNVRVEPALDEVEILTGAVAQPEHQTGGALIDAVRAREPWIGARQFGGEGALPLRRPYDRLVSPGVALLGNAACMVFPAHGSGIGVGLIAARLLADGVAGHPDPGGLDALWRFAVEFQREWGALLAAYDLFRRLSQSLDGAQVEQMLGAGLVSESSYVAGMDQRLPKPSFREALTTLRGAARAPRLALGAGGVLGRMPAVVATYRRYPRRPTGLARWSRTAARLFGDRPDVGG